MDAAAKPPRMGLRRLPQPDPPRLPTGSPLLLRLLLLLLLLLQLAAGAGRSPADKPRPATVRRTGNPEPASTLAR
ncbi:hypothetical protein CEE55_11675 [Stenotrophomonas pavanii]|uniref:Uncharacterized protein n=1 Tax=Stenotrophomonas pavanii TaxID=487698 RepID=A0A246KYI0_9GAMM|nr:hypothetical protein CEE55_11675 [Stenotrophomonas pavanii]